MKQLALILLVTPLALLLSCAEEPVPCFDYDIVDDYIYQVTFSNCSDLGVDYEWDFGDGNTSTEDNPTHTYESSGTYSVKLFVKGEKKEAEITQEVKIPDPLVIEASSEMTKTEYGEPMVFSIHCSAQNTIRSVKCVHNYDGVSDVILDSMFVDAQGTLNFDISKKAPFVYRDESTFDFILDDQQFEDDRVTLKFGSANTVDTTAGRVLTELRDGDDPFDFEYSYATGTFNKGKNKVEFTFYDEDGDYIQVSPVQAKEGVVDRFAVIAYDASTNITHEKEESRSASTDEMFLKTIDKENFTVTGNFKIDINLDSQVHDILQVDFTSINLTRVID